MDYFIYTLSDPRDGSIRYVGISKDAQKRFKQHLTRSDGNDAKNQWIGSLLRQRLQPVLDIIETLPDEASARKREKQWIMRYYLKGFPITNWNMKEPARGVARSNRQTALENAITRVEQTQSASLYAAGIAYFLQDLGFDFEEISQYLDRRAQEAGEQR